MKIGIFTDTYYPQINGVVTSVRMLEHELNKLGHTVFIFTTSDPNTRHSVPRVFRMPSMPFIFLPSHRFAFMYPPKLLLRMKSLKLDIIHTQTEFPIGIFGDIVAGLYNIPNIHTYHTMYEDYTHYVANGHLITPKAAQRFSRIFCNRAKAVIAPAKKTEEKLLEYGVSRPVHVIPTGLDFSPFSEEKYTKAEIIATKAELGLNETDPIVLFVGRVAKEKSIDVIVNAMPKLLAEMPNTKLLIVGGGPSLNDLKELTVNLCIENSVVFAGSKPWDAIGKYYQLGDVFVTASTSETQGLTYIEAMASKKPVVAKIAGSVEGIIIHGETGYSFEKDDELPEILRQVLNDREESRAVALRGYDSILGFSAKEFAEKVAALYEEVRANYKPQWRPKISLLKEFNLEALKIHKKSENK